MAIKYLAYLTANDDRSYVKDLINFRNMCRYNPGVEHIYLVVAVSAVRPFDDLDIMYINRLVSIFSACPWLTLNKVILKGNIGRDFSSAHVCLKEIEKYASDNDVVMVKNRSGYGPLSAGWFEVYEKLFVPGNNIGLVGSTINFSGHPKASTDGITTHVQTYVYVSIWKYFAEIVDNFPAISCVDRLNLIAEGEIGLSRLFLDRGLTLTCLAWPGQAFTREHPTDMSLPQTDIKKHPGKKIPIRYKFKSYGRWHLITKIVWSLLGKAKRGVPTGNDITITYSDSFGDVGIDITQSLPEWC